MPSHGSIILQAVAVNGGGCSISMMVDTGCTISCMPRPHIERLGLPIRRLRDPVTVAIADGSRHQITHEAKLVFRIGGYQSTLWIQESAGMLRSCDMLLGMEWMMAENPMICFSPLSMQLGGQDLTRYMKGRGRATGGCGPGCWGRGEKGSRGFGAQGSPPLSGGWTRDGAHRDLPDLCRIVGGSGVSGFDGGCSSGYYGGQGVHRPHMIPVYQHAETTDDGHSRCRQENVAGKQYDVDKQWTDWRKLFPDHAQCKSNLKIQSQGSVISKVQCTKPPKDNERSTQESVRVWIKKQTSNGHSPPLTHEHDSKLITSTATTRYRTLNNSVAKPTSKHESPQELLKDHTVLVPTIHTDKQIAHPEAHKHSTEKEEASGSTRRSAKDTRRLLKETKNRPGMYDLFH